MGIQIKSAASTLSILFLVSCSPKSERLEHTFRIYEEDGVTITETTGGPKYEEEIFTYERITELKEDEREESLLNPSDLPFCDERGWIYVPDGRSSSCRIAVFDDNGIYQYDIGRAGDGPGEFRMPRIMQVRGRTLHVWDSMLDRFTVFRVDGTFEHAYSFRGRTSFEQCYLLEGDRYLTIVTQGPIRPDREYQEFQTRIVTYSSLGDTIWSIFSEVIKGGRIIEHRLSGRSVYYAARKPFQARPEAVYRAGRGLLMTTGREPVLDFYDESGKRGLRIQIGLQLQPVTAEDRKVVERQYRDQLKQFEGDAQENLRRRLEFIEYPDFKAFWGGQYRLNVQVDDSGFIWIRIPDHFKKGGDSEKGFTYRVLGPEGEYLGITRQPPGSCRVSNGMLLQWKRHPETDEITISVYCIRPAVEGLEYP